MWIYYFIHTIYIQGGMRRCEMSYRRCESNVEEMMRMIDIEVRRR